MISFMDYLEPKDLCVKKALLYNSFPLILLHAPYIIYLVRHPNDTD
jgi:hypothetical protein